MGLQQFETVVWRLQTDGVEAFGAEELQETVIGDDEVAVHAVVALVEGQLVVLSRGRKGDGRQQA